MIQISESVEYKYFAVEVPKSATLIECENGIIFYEMPDSRIEKSIHIEKKYKDPELLGVIGGGEEISEEAAKEVGKADGITVLFPSGEKPKWAEWLKWFLGEKGILVENPIQTPIEPHKTDSYYEEGGMERFDSEWENYREDLCEWKLRESKLVKAVILKVKK